MTLPAEINPLIMYKQSSAYSINNSLRFRSSASAYMNRTPASASNQTTWTWSGWIKRGQLSSTAEFEIFNASYTALSTNYMRIMFYADSIYFDMTTGNVLQWRLATNAVYNDPSSWYHMVVVYNSGDATSSNRAAIYINGVQVTSFSTATYPSLNQAGYVNSVTTHALSSPNGAGFMDGYMAEINFIDGQALTPSSFGAYDATTGVWQPKKYTGTYGTNGFYLKFSNTSSTANLGLDYSGNSNTWTVNNVSLTAGSTYDAMIDAPPTYSATSGTQPAGNYAVLNPLNSAAINTFNANLECQANSGASNSYGTVISSFGQSSGKYYFEYYYVSASSPSVNSSVVGITRGALVPSSTNWGQADNNDGIGFNVLNSATGGNIVTNGAVSSTAWQGAVAAGNYVMVAVDCDNQKLYFGVNGTWRNSSNPATNTNGISLPAGGGTWVPFISGFRGSANGSIIQDINFGQQPFTYTPPAGFKSLCTSNLPAPSIVNGATAMAATLYTGTGAVANINNGTNTTLGTTFQPDLVWIKSRSNATNNNLFDSVDGATKYLSTNANLALTTNANTLTSFASSGYALGTDAGSVGVNISGNTYVGWSWLGGGAAVTNNAGTTPSQVSANPTAGFSVVQFVGQAGTYTFGHGLGAAPNMIFMFNTSVATTSNVYHSALNNGNPGTSYYLSTQSTNAQSSAAGIWGSTGITSTVIGATNGATISSGSTGICYCWTAIPGFSAFGSYVGNGSASGPFIYTGMRPRFVLVKSISYAAHWFMLDTSRDPYNIGQYYLEADSIGGEGSGIQFFNIFSNGFQPLNNYDMNQSGQTYIYAAFAENPFKYSLAR